MRKTFLLTTLVIVICVLLSGCVPYRAGKYHPIYYPNTAYVAEDIDMCFKTGSDSSAPILGRIVIEGEETEFSLFTGSHSATVFISFGTNKENAEAFKLGYWRSWEMNDETFIIHTIEFLYAESGKKTITFHDGDKIVFNKQTK